MIRKICSKDYLNFLQFCELEDKYQDFYIIEDNQRKFLTNITVAKKIFNNALKHGDKAFICEEHGLIKGILLIVGFSDKAEKKFIKVFSYNKEVIEDLFRVLNWNCVQEIFIKIKKKNPILHLLNSRQFTYKEEKQFGFQFVGLRGEEILFKYIPSKRNFNIPDYFRKDEDE